MVSPEVTQSVGLAVTELVTNAVRHAFWPERPGTVRVTGEGCGKGWYRLRIEDDGKGLPPGFDLRLRPSGLGLRLVNVLADQLQGRLSVDGHAGTCFDLTIPVGPAGGNLLDRPGLAPAGEPRGPDRAGVHPMISGTAS